MRPRTTLILCLFMFCSVVMLSEAKMQQQVAIDEDEDEDDDWDDDDDDDENYPTKPEVDDDGRIYKNPRNSPSADCPRNENQANVLGQKCLRKCSTDEDCKSKKKKCRCDGVCGMSCIKPERECPELDSFQYGTMTVTGKFFGDKATYVCDSGYNLVGVTERVCRADGRWSSTTPNCKKDPNAFCSAPPKVKYAKFNATTEQTTFDLESTVQYFCEDGYHVSTGFERAKCLMMEGSAKWFGPDLNCEPKSCHSPPEITNGRHAGECYTYSCHITYHCAEGYELVGRAEKMCLSDATWYPKEMPQCVQVASVTCPSPEEPANGTIFYTSLAYNSVVSYDCKHGFTRVGQATRRCGADKRWTGQAPTCKEIDCGSPGILYNGWIENIDQGTGLGASIIFRCNEHMKLEGNSSSLCQIDGKWRHPLPQCLAPCVVPQIENGRIIVASQDRDVINNATVVEHGEQLIVECVQDYEFAANSTPVVCNNGTWTIVPSCSPARCKQMPKPPKNGMVIAPKTNHGMKAIFQCKDGFEMVGGGPMNNSFSVECSYGVWIGDIPHCVELYCPFPGYVENGKVMLVGNMGVYDYRPYVKKIMNNKQIMYDCEKGYHLNEGPQGATCIGGKWSPAELPKCILSQHPRIRFTRRRRSVGETLKNETVVMAYQKFIDFFRKISKKLLILEMDKSHNQFSYGPLRSNETDATGNYTTYNETKQQHVIHENRSRTWDGKMVDFLKVVYRKLQRIDSRHADNATNITMHELLNAMSQNFFHVDLSAPRKNNKNRESFEVKNQREFTKLKREFERIMRFYNKSMRWSEKQLRKRNKKQKGRGGKGKSAKNKKKHRNVNFYNELQEFLNIYMNEKTSNNNASKTTEGLIAKLNIDKIGVVNGTAFSVNEIYPFLRHIMETVINSSKTNQQHHNTETTTFATALATNGTTEKLQSTTTAKGTPMLDNEIPTAETGLPKHRIRRIRNANLVHSHEKRKLLSLDSLLSDVSETKFKNRGIQNQKPKINAGWLNRAKRYLSPAELNNQKILKNKYVNAYENEYNANVRRSVSKNNQ